jgi:UDP-N-acetylglucosamine--N-acetylmuramyl-(pentapeptide) pyrophosphoryl-undecaprenol N-acetylglucosamine transferase
MADKHGPVCLIAAGGTAGHVLPSIAVAEALRRRGVTVTFAGSPDRVEARLVPEAGFAFDPFRISGLPRRPSLALASSLVRAAGAVRECRRILRRRRPDVVLGGGGFVAGPMVAAAASMRIPAAVTEADAHLGLANRLAAPLAQRVFLAYELDGLGPPKYRVVGRPIPARSRAVPMREARARFGLPEDGPVLAVFGARAGARSLNQLAVDAWGKGGPAVLHLSGEREYEELRGRVDRPGYVLLPTTDEFGAALSAADLALSRAGGTVWELAAAGLPAVLVPYPHATGDHQTKNARHFERGGGAIVVPEDDLARVPALVESLLADGDRLRAMGEAMRGLARVDAADRIAEELIGLAAARR